MYQADALSRILDWFRCIKMHKAMNKDCTNLVLGYYTIADAKIINPHIEFDKIKKE